MSRPAAPDVASMVKRPPSGEMVPIAAWFYAYTSLGCDPNSAEKMVRAEIANYSAAEAEGRKG